MSNPLDELKVPSIEDIIKKYEVPPKNNATARNSLITKIKGLGRTLSLSDFIGVMLAFVVPVVIGSAVFYSARVSSVLAKDITSIVNKYADIDESGAIDSEEEKKKIKELLSGIAKSHNAKYYSARVPTYNDGLTIHGGFYCGDEICDLGEVGEWVKAYDLEHSKGERK